MAEVQFPNLTRAQISVLEKLLRAGFKFVTFERYARYLGVEKEGFVALLDTTQGKVRALTEVGYRVGEEIAVLAERREGKAFVWHGETVVASPDLLAVYERVKTEFQELLEPSPQ